MLTDAIVTSAEPQSFQQGAMGSDGCWSDNITPGEQAAVIADITADLGVGPFAQNAYATPFEGQMQGPFGMGMACKSSYLLSPSVIE